MDANATLASMLAAIANRDSETLAEFAEYLEQWTSRGGFLPAELESIAGELAAETDSMETATGRREVDEAGDDEGLEFRIFIRPDGNLELAVGDPCYDTDHRGYCGAGTIVAGDSLDDCRAATLDAFWQAVDSAA
jgi:hypothetical protein